MHAARCRSSRAGPRSRSTRSLRPGDADAESGPLLLPVADYIRMLGIDVARPCLHELAAKGRITQRLDVDHISFPTWTPYE